jgi:endogenous inhibitor of DNA gyrase (YacG/DUF329 family)
VERVNGLSDLLQAPDVKYAPFCSPLRGRGPVALAEGHYAIPGAQTGEEDEDGQSSRSESSENRD